MSAVIGIDPSLTATEPDHLFSPQVTAHCFWWHCTHTETGAPNEAHDAMERHYAREHRAEIAALLGPWRTR